MKYRVARNYGIEVQLVSPPEVGRLEWIRLCILRATDLHSSCDIEKAWERQIFVWQKPGKELWGYHNCFNEKWFNIDSQSSDDQVYKEKPTLENRMTSRRRKPKQVIVWGRINRLWQDTPFFVPRGVKVQGPQYHAIMKGKVCFGPNNISERKCGPFNRMMPDLIGTKKCRNEQD